LNFRENSNMDTVPVEVYPQGASPYGVEQMSGNVWERTHTLWHGYNYPYKVDDGREEESNSALRVIRGGGFNSESRYVRAAVRDGYSTPSNYLGFRVAFAPLLS
jgi:formylglycine-generating enzyme required for sulfatase activity